MAETSLLESIGRVGEVFRGRAGVPGPEGRQRKGEYDVETGRKIRQAPAYLQRLGVGRIGPNQKYAKPVARFAYTAEVVFLLFASLVLIELFVRDRTALLAVHSSRIVSMLAVALLTIYNMYRGYVYPEVDIRFYVVELLVVLAINIAALVVSSIRISEKRQRNEPIGMGDIAAVGLAGALIVMNTALLGQQWYRWRLGKRETPVASFFTLVMAVVLAAASGNSIRRLLTTSAQGPT